ncbi:hypothetical protein E6W36_16005 [Hankyongella ginsenosidimutans]|uniref:Di-haem cytochrome c peroxidase domain-containing protein n=1 Tax=Hankyongella ginsenosidimutans TaxID=1763828 RepID=A0A4D7C9L0_9SPHN|nr:hypothetical protein E6W36_16005 [Hankyongella ginsenosidimutans]
MERRAICRSPENPQTPEKIALGRKLYFDPSLSKTGTVACASCHDPRAGFEDGKDRSIGVTGERLPRHSPTTINLAWSEAYFWDGRAASLEEQALGPIAAERKWACRMTWLCPSSRPTLSIRGNSQRPFLVKIYRFKRLRRRSPPSSAH